jgi:hypothetical protein
LFAVSTVTIQLSCVSALPQFFLGFFLQIVFVIVMLGIVGGGLAFGIHKSKQIDQ